MDDAGDAYLRSGGRIIRLAGETGAEYWHADVVAADLGLGPTGSVVALEFPTDIPEQFVERLDRASGGSIWRVAIPAFAGLPVDLVTDHSGDVVIAGSPSPSPPGGSRELSIVKLAGATGSLLWQRNVAVGEPGYLSNLAIDPANAVMVVAASQPVMAVKLTGDTGRVAWTSTVGRGFVDALTFYPNGDVFASGRLGCRPPEGALLGCRLTLVSLAGTDGRPRWRRERIGRLLGGKATAIGAGHAAVAGALFGRRRSSFAVVGVCARDGGGRCR